MLVIRDEIVSVKQEDSTKPRPADKSQQISRGKPIPEGDQPQQVSRGRPTPKRARAGRNARSARGNRRIRPMPRQQGRAISDAILIFQR